ncbi:MAG: DUF1302 family protein [Myxococcota bacterium]
MLVAALALLSPGVARAEDEPTLPAGLGDAPDEPALPDGLGDETEEAEALEADEEDGLREALPFELTGFLDGRGGVRTQDDPEQSGAMLSEVRAQVEAGRRWTRASARLTFDLLYDGAGDEHDVDLETGDGWLDLREAFVAGSVGGWLDLKAGRQILTWGTGDLIFINDLFPKDFVSFFIGRDVAYLKAPSDAIKASVFTPWANLDVVYTPRFDADRHLDGSRVSFYDPGRGDRIGEDEAISVEQPERWLEDDEIAVRLYRSFGALELRAYGYHGFWKSPAGVDPTSGRATFPRLAVYGASARGPLLGGIANVELGYYDSLDDRDGDDPTVRNSELRGLVGYERELARDLTAGVQYYLEWMLDHSDHRRSLPTGSFVRDEDRHTLTLRLTQLLLQQNLELGLFVFWTPSDQDVYVRPRVAYKLTDRWRVEVGANVFSGEDRETFWGQFHRSTNVYGALRYSY